MPSSTGRPPAPNPPAPNPPLPNPPLPNPSEGTDPDLADVLESLYRDSGRRHRALPRFEPALTPPEDAEDYAWLYRPEPVVATEVARGPAAETVVRAPAPTPVAAPPVSRRGWVVPLLVTGSLAGTALVVPVLAHLL